MEKIYMENHQGYNQNKQNNQNNRSMFSSVSLMLSFVLAFVSILSIVVSGFGNVSFAIPDESATAFPNTIVTGEEGNDYEKYRTETEKTF